MAEESDSARLKRIEEKIDRLADTTSLLVEVVKLHSQRFDDIDKRLDGIDNRLDGIDNRLDGIEKSTQVSP